MEQRHIDAITSRLEDVYLHGCSHITEAELYYWYDKKRISVEPYRDLEARWQIISKAEKGPLLKVEGRSGIFLFAKETVEQVYNSIAKYE
jgi:hypothetical protein